MKTAILLTVLALGAPPSGDATELSYRNGFIHLPSAQREMIRGHLATIVAKRWGVLGPGELYHGHIILSPTVRETKRFESLEELFSHMTMILYHSDETMNRWWGLEDHLPPAERTPRSLVAFPDGRIVPAVSLMGEALKEARSYERSGSICERDLARAMPALAADLRLREVLVGDSLCRTHLQFEFGIGHPPAPLITVTGMQLQVTLDCIAHDAVIVP